MQNIADIVRFGAERWPNSDCVTYGNRAHTYQEFSVLIGGMAQRLGAVGIGPADSAVIIGDNSDLTLASYFALAQLGATNVPLNAMLTPIEAADVVQRTGAKAVLYGIEYEEFVARLRPLAPTVQTWMPLDAGQNADTSQWPHAPMTISRRGGNDAAFVIFTSGSTGRPKGCVKTHSNMIWHAVNVQLSMPKVADDRELFVIPMAGIGFANSILSSLLGGASVYLERFEPTRALDAIERHRISILFMPPTMLHSLLQVGGQEQRDLTSLRRLETGYQISGRLRDSIAARFGGIVRYGYGTSEGSCSYAPAELFLTDPTCVGRVLGLDEIAIVDPEGRHVPDGQVGEIALRGPSILHQYLDDSALTKAAIDDGGWFHTGDLGRMSPGRMLHFVGRLKDMIKTGGSNVAAAEVEANLATHPDVNAVAVVGVQDDKWGEAVVAVIAPAPASGLTAEALTAFARSGLAAYKRPKHYVLVDELPLNPSGKVAKGQVQELAQRWVQLKEKN